MSDRERTFPLKRSLVRQTRVAIWFLAGLSLAALVFVIWQAIRPSNPPAAVVIAGLGGLLFGGFAGFGYRSTRDFPRADTVVDDDGLWPASVGKADGLVPWRDIASTKERRFGQRLELRDAAGVVLLRLEYQLEGFEELRDLVLQRIGGPGRLTTCPAVFRKSRLYHVGEALTVAVFGMLGTTIAVERPWIGLSLLGMAAFLFLSSYLRITLADVKNGQHHGTGPITSL